MIPERKFLDIFKRECVKTCRGAIVRVAFAMALMAWAIAASMTLGATSAPAPRYYRCDALKTTALAHLVVGDFDGDGWADLAGVSESAQQLVVMRAKGQFEFHSPQPVALADRVQSILVADLTGEKGALLIILTAPPERAQAWRATRKGDRLFFKKIAELPLSAGADRLYLSPRRQNGKRQIFARSQDGRLTCFWFGAKSGFSKAEPVALSHRVAELILPYAPSTDFFAQALGENALWLIRPSPFSPFPIRCKDAVSLAACADFNKNGVLDLVVAQRAPNEKTIVETMFDVGVETNVPPARFETIENPTSLFINDFDHDGWLDIALRDERSLAIHFGSKTGQFSEAFAIAFADVASSLAIADLNADGKPELICSERQTGKLVVYSPSHCERRRLERIAMGGAPECLAWSAGQQEVWVGCDGAIARLSAERREARDETFATRGRIVSLWHSDALRQTIAIANSPAALVQIGHNPQRLQTRPLFTLGVSAAAFWDAPDHRAAIVALLEAKSPGAVPQLLFYAVSDDSLNPVSELMLEQPLHADDIAAIASATLKRKSSLIVLKSDERQASVVAYALAIERTRLRLVEEARYALPDWFAAQRPTRLRVRIRKNDAMDFLVASDKAALLLLSERLHQPKRISNFPKISASDLVEWRDVDGDLRDDLLVSRRQRAELLLLRGNANDRLGAPKIVLNDVTATSVLPVSRKPHPILFVGNAKLRALDVMRFAK